MKTMLTIFITLCLSVALFTTKLYWPLSAVGFSVVFGILPLLFVAESPYHPQQPSIRDNSRNYGTTDLRNHGNWATRCYARLRRAELWNHGQGEAEYSYSLLRRTTRRLVNETTNKAAAAKSSLCTSILSLPFDNYGLLCINFSSVQYNSK